jgi:hypothetical protein
MIVLIFLFTLCDWASFTSHGTPKRSQKTKAADHGQEPLWDKTHVCLREGGAPNLGGFLVILLDKRGMVP